MAKYYDKRTLNHELAIAWVKQQILAMRFALNETHLEAGIDAFVELADPQTGESHASFLGIQVKTCERFDAETTDKFSFYAAGEDITYWMASNIPILLIVCRAKTEEAYAIWIREYFEAPKNQGSKTVVFSKERDRFRGGDDWQRRLVGVGMPSTCGFSFPPVPKVEEVSSNLIEALLPETIFQAITKLKDRYSIIEELKARGHESHEFILKDELILSVHPLSDRLWEGAVEPGTTEAMKFSEYAFNVDPAKRRYAVELLNLCLSARLYQDEVYWFKEEDMYVYAPKREVNKRLRKSIKTEDSEARRGLIFPTEFRGRIVRVRHLAFTANFLEIAGAYYLQIDPTYFFSRDGMQKHPRSEDLIRQARILQKEQDYHNNLEVWREVLTQPADLARQEYPFLRFKDYHKFLSPVSIPDLVWNPPKSFDKSDEGDLDQQLSLLP